MAKASIIQDYKSLYIHFVYKDAKKLDPRDLARTGGLSVTKGQLQPNALPAELLGAVFLPILNGKCLKYSEFTPRRATDPKIGNVNEIFRLIAAC